MNQENRNFLGDINSKFDGISSIIILGIIAVGGYIFRLIFFPFEIPVVLDGSSYFWYGLDMSILGNFPVNYDIVNNIWPTLLSLFFSLFSSDRFIDYMNLQRMISTIISILTIFPIYFLCKYFFTKKIALMGSIMFVFEPRIIHNSFLGITEPLFVFLGVTTIGLFLNSNHKLVFLSFGIAGLFSLVRYEGILIIIPMTILYFYRYKKQNKVILKYLLALSIFVIVLLPMSSVRMSTMGYDGILSHVKDGVIVATTQNVLNENPDKQKFFPTLGVINFIKLFGWVLIPNFIIFIPFGLFLLSKKRNWQLNYFILISIFSIIPAFYAYSRGISDTRYLLMLYPIVIIISLFSIEWITSKIKKKNLILIIITSGIILSSGIFLEIKIDNQHEKEAFEIALKNTPYLSVINSYYPESVYYKTTIIDEVEEFPILKEDIPRKISILTTSSFNSLEDFLVENEDKGLKHIVTDNTKNRLEFLKKVFYNEVDYPYLTKIYDSKEDGFEYHLKIFEINYNQFNELRK